MATHPMLPTICYRLVPSLMARIKALERDARIYIASKRLSLLWLPCFQPELNDEDDEWLIDLPQIQQSLSGKSLALSHDVYL